MIIKLIESELLEERTFEKFEFLLDNMKPLDSDKETGPKQLK